MSNAKLLTELFGDLSDLDRSPPRAPDPEPNARSGQLARRPIPKVGTRIQRGDASQQRRAAFWAEPAAPPPSRRRRTPAPDPPRRTGVCAAILRAAALLPPAPTSARIAPSTSSRAKATPTVQKPEAGPAPAATVPATAPQPVPVTLPTGEVVEVLYFAAHRNRKFRARTATAR